MSQPWLQGFTHMKLIQSFKTTTFKGLWMLSDAALFLLYSCFKKGCLANGEKLTQQYRKLLSWLNVVFTVA